MTDPEKCEKAVFYAENKPIGNPVPPPPCGEEPKKLPQELVEPKGELETYSPYELPRPITLYSAPVTARCEEDVLDSTSYPDLPPIPSEGVPVSIEGGKYTETISIQAVAGIDISILVYIAKAKLEDEIEEALRTRSLTLGALTKLTGIPPSKAATFLQLAETRQRVLDDTAKTAAIGALYCLWWNVAQTASCADDYGMEGAATTSEHPSAVATSIVPDRTVASRVGRGEADTIAKAQAVAALECFYVSDPVEVDCTTRPDKPEEFTEWVPTDPVGVVPRRVGYYSLPAGFVVSTVSKEDATNTAIQLALSELNCFYVSSRIDIQCEDPDARNVNVDPEWAGDEPIGLYLGTLPEGTALEDNYRWTIDPDSRIQAQKVIVPERYIISTISSSDANNQARQLAESLLSCCFINDRIFIECPEEANRDYSPTWSYEVPRGAFVSCVSKKDANDQAWASAEGIVDCVYCNDIVLPQCVPNWVTDAVTNGIFLERDIEMNGHVYPAGSLFKLPLPLKVEGLVNPYTGELVNVADWSTDATVGVAKDTVCSTSKREVNELVELLPAVVTEPKTGVPSCHFKSTRLLAGCSFADPYNPNDVAELDNKDDGDSESHIARSATHLYEPAPILYYGTDNEGKRYRAYKAKPTRSISSVLSSPVPGEYLDFPEGLFTATAEDVPDYKGRVEDLSLDEAESLVKRYLDGLVLELAKSVIECRYGNPKTVVACSARRYTPSYSGRYRSGDIIGDGYTGYNDPVARTRGWRYGWSKPTAQLAPGSTERSTRNGKETIIEANTIQGYVYQDVMKETLALADSLLYCKYINTRKTCSVVCDIDESIVGVHVLTAGTGSVSVVEAGTIIADDATTADRMAQSMLTCAADICLYGNDHMWKACWCSSSQIGGAITRFDNVKPPDRSDPNSQYHYTEVPEDMFIGPDPAEVRAAALSYWQEVCMAACFATIKQKILFLSAELKYKCKEVEKQTCVLKGTVEDETVVSFKTDGAFVSELEIELEPTACPEEIVIPAGLFAAEKQEDVSEDVVKEFAKGLCSCLWTHTTEVEYQTTISVVSFLYKPGAVPGYDTTTAKDYVNYTLMDPLTEQYTLSAGTVTADTPEGVCDEIIAIAAAGNLSTARAATLAASRWYAGVSESEEGGVSSLGEVRGVQYTTGTDPLIVDGDIRLNYANFTGNDASAGVIKSIEASNTDAYKIEDGAIHVPYADEAKGIYGVIGKVQTSNEADAKLKLEDGVLTIPSSDVDITGIEYDKTYADPAITNGIIKLTVAQFEDQTTRLGAVNHITVMPELLSPKIKDGDIQLNLANSTYPGVISSAVCQGTKLGVVNGVIRIPKANKATSREGLIENIEAATDTNWDIADGVIKVALAKDDAAGIIKKVEISSTETKPTISDGVIKIPELTIEFDPTWFIKGDQVTLNEATLDAKAREIAPTVSSQITSTATAVIDTYTDTSASPPNGPSGTIQMTVNTTSGETASASMSTVRDS